KNAEAGFASRPALLTLSHLRRVEAGDRLHLEIFLETELAPLAAVARLLVAAERRGAVVRNALQVDVAGADLTAHLARTLDSACGHITRKTVGRFVGDAHGVRLILGAHDREHRSEDLLFRDGHLFGYVGEHGRPHIEALVDAFRQTGTAGDQRRAFLDSLLDQGLDLVPLVAVDHRTDGGAF